MRLPESLHQRSFSDWNYLVRGLVEVWELARLLGLDEELEEQLARDEDGSLTEQLGRYGNDCAAVAVLVQRRLRASFHPTDANSHVPAWARQEGGTPDGRNGWRGRLVRATSRE